MKQVTTEANNSRAMPTGTKVEYLFYYYGHIIPIVRNLNPTHTHSILLTKIHCTRMYVWRFEMYVRVY